MDQFCIFYWSPGPIFGRTNFPVTVRKLERANTEQYGKLFYGRLRRAMASASDSRRKSKRTRRSEGGGKKFIYLAVAVMVIALAGKFYLAQLTRRKQSSKSRLWIMLASATPAYLPPSLPLSPFPSPVKDNFSSHWVPKLKPQKDDSYLYGGKQC